MTKDEVLKLIEECGATEFGDQSYFNGNEWVESPRFIVDDGNLLAFANAIEQKAMEKQREKDAQECERMMMYPGGRCEAPAHNNVWEAANAIRENKE